MPLDYPPGRLTVQKRIGLRNRKSAVRTHQRTEKIVGGNLNHAYGGSQ